MLACCIYAYVIRHQSHGQRQVSFIGLFSHLYVSVDLYKTCLVWALACCMCAYVSRGVCPCAIACKGRSAKDEKTLFHTSLDTTPVAHQQLGAKIHSLFTCIRLFRHDSNGTRTAERKDRSLECISFRGLLYSFPFTCIHLF